MWKFTEQVPAGRRGGGEEQKARRCRINVFITKPVTTSKEIVIKKLRKPNTASYSIRSEFSEIYSSQLQNSSNVAAGV
jgi:hypothetical protein